MPSREYTEQVRERAVLALLEHLDSHDLVNSLSVRFIEVNAPRVDTGGRTEMRCLTMANGGTGGAVSFKPGNLVLNLRDCCSAIATGAIGAIGASTSPMLIVGALILMCDTVHRASSIDLTPDEASVAWAIHFGSGDGHSASDTELISVVNQLRSEVGRPTLSPQQVFDAVAKLMEIRAAEYDHEAPGRIRLCEKITVKL